MPRKSLDPGTKNSIVVTASIFGGSKTITGLADEDFFEIDYREDHVQAVIDSQGNPTFKTNSDRSATVTLRLLESSRSNNDLSQLHDLKIKFVMLITDKAKNDGDPTFCNECMILKPARKVYNTKNVTTREWIILCGRALVEHKGTADE